MNNNSLVEPVNMMKGSQEDVVLFFKELQAKRVGNQWFTGSNLQQHLRYTEQLNRVTNAFHSQSLGTLDQQGQTL